ncbi:unnamed protein product [Moneuplotes crassus]|uniref:Kelch motif family protein n=2 Tax=Euplotes crassus TaxID=5936 RepID=A0AAD1Y089_EUPCR|nr:unnamed protein product [Moneuplotes crassus]
MKDMRRTQLNSFFEAVKEEVERCQRDYTIDLDNDEIIFGQEFEEIEERIGYITSQIRDAQNTKSQNNSEIEGEETYDHELEEKVKEISQNIQKVIEESEGYEKSDYLIAYSREDLRDRIDCLFYHSLKHKQNTSLFDFDFDQNRIIKTEIFQKGTLKDLLCGEIDESHIPGLGQPKSFIHAQNISKSLMDISVAFNTGSTVQKKGHNRNLSNISSGQRRGSASMNISPIKKDDSKIFKEVEAIRREIKLDYSFSLPKKLFPLILREGRIFFIGGREHDSSSPAFIEYLEESNSVYFHKEMNVGREDHGSICVDGRIYSIGGYDFRKEKWIDSIESIQIPQRPRTSYLYNYETLAAHETLTSNQEESSPRNNWMMHNSKLILARSHMICATQMERYIYIFVGKYGAPDIDQTYLIHREMTHTIECYDTLTDTIQEYTIKSCYKIDKCFSPGCVSILEPKGKIPALLFFGGKYEFSRKKITKFMDKSFLIYPQDQDRCKQLSQKSRIKGCDLRIKASGLHPLDKKFKPGQGARTVKVFNGDSQCIRDLHMYCEDMDYYYFLGCREKCTKLENEDQFVVDNKGILDSIFRKNPDKNIETNLKIKNNLNAAYKRTYGIDKFDPERLENSFVHPRHGHSLFMLDKSTAKWTSVPVVKYPKGNMRY